MCWTDLQTPFLSSAVLQGTLGAVSDPRSVSQTLGLTFGQSKRLATKAPRHHRHLLPPWRVKEMAKARDRISLTTQDYLMKHFGFLQVPNLAPAYTSNSKSLAGGEG